MITPGPGYSDVLNNGYLCCKNGAAQAWIEFGGISTSFNQIIVLAENVALFQERNPLAEPVEIFEVGSLFFDSLDPAGDAIAVWIGGWYPTVAWGTGGRPAHGTDEGHAWTTNTIAAPAVGQVIRYAYNDAATLDKDHFIVDYLDMAGYRMGGEDPWVQVTLPRLGLTLRDDITNTTPAASSKLYLSRGGADCTEGLAASGTIQIANEQISYSSRDRDGVIVSARGANSTSAAAHTAGDLIRVVDTDGIATQGPLVESIGWSRARAPYPQSFKIRYSNLDAARVPSDDNHDEDYTTETITGNAASSYTLALSPSKRVSIVLIEIDHMTVDPARPRLNDITIVADPDQYASDVVIAAQDAIYVIGQILTNAGIPVGALAFTPGAVTLDDLETAEGESAWSVAADLAARTDVLVNARRDGKILIAPNNLPAGALSAAATFSEVSAASVEFVQNGAAAVAQVRQPYRLADGTTDIARYPTTPVHIAGQIVDAEETRYASAGTALAAAKRHFILARYPVTLVVTCAEGQIDRRPGDVVRVQWQYADDMQTIDRIGIVVGADHEIRGGILSTVLTVAQVDREWPG